MAISRLCFAGLPVAMAIALTACGGGGVVSAPPPPPSVTPPRVTGTQIAIGSALPPSPALISGTSDTFGIVATPDERGAAIGKLDPSDLRIVVDASTKTYTLLFDPVVFPGVTGAGEPAGQRIYTIEDERYGYAYSRTTNYSDGTRQVENLKGERGGKSVFSETSQYSPSTFFSHTGKAHVSLGRWVWLDEGESFVQEVLFAYGRRTPPAALPATGTATYLATNFIYSLTNNDAQDSGAAEQTAAITLTADFGARSVGAKVSTVQDWGLDSFRKSIYQDLSGSGKIEAPGAFEIALVGTLKIGEGSSGTSVVTGALGGAFFGPDASQIGGYLDLPGIPTVNNPFYDVFVATRD